MALLYRDTLRPRTGARTPGWLLGALNVQRLEGEDGDVVGHWDPMVFSPAQNAAGARWQALPDGWQVALLGDLIPDLLLRQDPDLPMVLPIEDGKGRIWRAPAVLAPDADPSRPSRTGAVAMVLPWGRDETGSWCRIPDDRQAPLIATARAIREEAVSGRLMETPMDVVAGWAATLMCGLYHVSPDVVAQLRLFDDKLIFSYCLASAGLIPGRS